MDKFFLFILFIIPKISFSQDYINTNKDTAFRYYLENKYDSALKYYLKVNSNDNKVKTYINYQLGNCYKELGKFEIAKKFYTLTIKDSTTIDKIYFSQRSSCLEMANIFLNEKEFAKSLDFLKLAERKFPHHRICSAGEFERKIKMKYEFAKCFEGLNQVDSAIIYLTPYMFAKTENISIDSIEYLKILNFYYEKLNLKISSCEISSAMTLSIQNIFYNKADDSASNRIDPNNNHYEVECYLTFFGSKIWLLNNGYDTKSWGGDPVLFFTKEYALKEFYETPMMKIIRN
jgi:tetratricopeptide (TPR) repeat protein